MSGPDNLTYFPTTFLPCGSLVTVVAATTATAGPVVQWRCAPPSLALRAGHNPLIALRATRPNRDGPADMAAEPRACVVRLRVRSSAAPHPPPRLQAARLVVRRRCSRSTRAVLLVALRDSTDSRRYTSVTSMRSPQSAYISPSTCVLAWTQDACAPTREVSDSARQRTSCVASARVYPSDWWHGTAHARASGRRGLRRQPGGLRRRAEHLCRVARF
jgi:hypothetical protein